MRDEKLDQEIERVERDAELDIPEDARKRVAGLKGE